MSIVHHGSLEFAGSQRLKRVQHDVAGITKSHYDDPAGRAVASAIRPSSAVASGLVPHELDLREREPAEAWPQPLRGVD